MPTRSARVAPVPGAAAGAGGGSAGDTAAGSTLAVVLAAGHGTRMRSTTPKVLHALCGRTMLGHVLAAVAGAGVGPAATVVVVAAGRDAVVASLPELVRHADQGEPRGTGHAVRVALAAAPIPPPTATPAPASGLDTEAQAATSRAALTDTDRPHTVLPDTVLVVPGDAPLLRAETLAALLAAHRQNTAAVTLLTAELDDPTGYGRVLRAPDGAVIRIVEQADADAAVRAVREVAVSVYAFDRAALVDAVEKLGTGNAQGEEYLTDTVAALAASGRGVAAVRVADPTEVHGVNDRVQLAAARRALRDRLIRAAMLAGVTVTDPLTTWLGVGVTYEPDATIHQNTQLHGATHLAAGCTVGPNATLTDTAVGPGASVVASTAVGAVVGPGATVGPYAYLRPGTVLADAAKVGAFVEAKNAAVGPRSKVPHLSYVGDVQIGADSNVGAATVVVNYDGVAKHRTVIGDRVRIGSDTMLVAPVTIGDGAYTAAGSVIVDDVPPGALGVGRARQRNIEGWVARRRGGAAGAPHADPGGPADGHPAPGAPPDAPPDAAPGAAPATSAAPET